MNPQQILQARANRKTRLGRPFENFFLSFNQCLDAGNLLLKGEVAQELSSLLGRSVVITGVTAVEVYFRDILDLMFKYCSPDFFSPKLKAIHPEKYDIDDLLAVYKHSIHPLELVLNSQSFQNTEKIDRVFSKFLPKGLWATVLTLEARVKEKPDTIATWNAANLDGLKSTFELRHELVHDPARTKFFTDQVMEKLWDAVHMVFGADLVLSKMLADNKDPTLANENDA